jgi:bacterial/archaeal transporter family protein
MFIISTAKYSQFTTIKVPNANIHAPNFLSGGNLYTCRPMWILFGIFSSVFLGFHEIFKKVSLNQNAVLPVLLFGSVASALIFIPFLFISMLSPDLAQSCRIYIPSVVPAGHLLFLIKSLIVSMAWLFGYFSVKHLPVTLLAPLNASGPVWTMLGAMLIYSERMNGLQWAGVAISLGFYYAMSFGGNIRGNDQKDKRWIFFAFLSIIFNSASALLDKYLVRQYDRIAMQAWFSIYTALIFLLILLIIWYPARKTTTLFKWRWAIPLIGIVLVIADFFYFKALSFDHSLVSVLIIIRRSSAVIVFGAGALYFRETSLRKRGMVLAGILAGVALVVIGSM